MRRIETKLSEISQFRWVIFIASTISITLMSMSVIEMVGGGNSYSLYEFIIYNNQNSLSILFIYLFPVLLIISDVYSSRNRWHDVVVYKYSSRFKWVLSQLQYIVFICVFMVVVQSVLFTVACITINGVDISLYSSWSEWFLKSEAISKELIAEYTPPVLMIISQSLLILRYIFLSLIIFIINLLCKRYPLGVLGAMIVSVVDWLFYEVVYVLTGSYKSLYILPIEHTVLFRIGGFGIENLMNDAERIGVGYSYLYWIVIIATLFYIVYRIVLKKDFMCQEQVR